MLLGIFGSKWENVTEDWRDIHSGEPHSVYPFTNTIFINENIEDVKVMVCIMYGRGYKWKLLLWRPGRRWEGKNNVKF